ncbi:AMP-binding protein [Streptomyces sp. NPDC059070]|uniref:AMP-binding protein n=1 Tax=Streptomyces sp. NPDC059070 TaxID=3346713 RepID=UPI003687B15F
MSGSGAGAGVSTCRADTGTDTGASSTAAATGTEPSTTAASPGPTAHDWLAHHAAVRPYAPAVTVERGGHTVAHLDFGGLAALVDRCAAGLRSRGAVAGDRVLLSLPNDHTFTAALLACVGAGLVAVPAPTPEAVREEAFRERIAGIAADCRPTLVITSARWRDHLRRVLPPATAPEAVHTWEDLADPAARPLPPGTGARTCDIAFLQYTSGSTGRPKGVAIGHRALRASCAQAAEVYGERTTDTAVTWVPLHHDMGLVTGVLRPLHSGYRSVLLCPREFVRSPAGWLSAVTRHRATLSSAPDFAYRHCVRKIPAAEAAAFRLGTWRVARDAGEVVRADTAEAFTGRFGPAGFPASAFCPSYGMAEATLTVTASTPDRPPLRLAVARDALLRGRAVPVDGLAVPVDGSAGDGRAGGEGSAVVLLSSGTPLPHTRVRVGGVPQDGWIGDILVQGPQLFSGYWPVAGGRSRAAGDGDGDGWHATGDRGFLHQGHLFVVGRGDDTLVHHGRNFYAADVQAVLAAVPGLRPGRSAAFTLDTGTGTADRSPGVCLVSEIDEGVGPAGEDGDARGELAARVRRQLARTLDLYVSTVVFLAPGHLPVTTSGKVRHAETRRRLAAGELAALYPVPPVSPVSPVGAAVTPG